MSEALFLELEDHIGIEPDHMHDPKTREIIDHPNAGQPGPLVHESCSYAVPTLVGGEIIPVTRHVHIGQSDTTVGTVRHVDVSSDVTSDARIIPGTRQIETNNAQLASVLEQGGYQRIDPPKSQRVARGKNASGEKDGE